MTAKHEWVIKVFKKYYIGDIKISNFQKPNKLIVCLVRENNAEKVRTGVNLTTSIRKRTKNQF